MAITTLREYIELELEVLRRRYADVTDPSRQVESTQEGREYRQRLKQDIAELEQRLATEDTSCTPESPTTTESPGCRRSPEDSQSDKEREPFALQSQEPF